jgi:predicted nucleotidyltransferase
MLNLRSQITRAVLGYLFLQEETEMYVNELSRRLSLESGNLTRKLIQLEKEGILKSRWQGSQKYYSLNTGFPLFKEYKSIVLKTVGFEHVLKDRLKKVPGIRKVIIFGSYAEDKMDTLSDIDVLVVGDCDMIFLQKEIAAIQKAVGREINMVSMPLKEYQRRRTTDPLLKSIHQKKHILVL